MAFLIDTDVLIDHLDDNPAAVELMRQLTAEVIAISALTYMEVYEGVFRHHARLPRFIELLNRIPVIAISRPVAHRAAQLRFLLRNERNLRVERRAIDILIAATAIELDLTLVTRNVDDFRHIAGLQLQSA